MTPEEQKARNRAHYLRYRESILAKDRKRREGPNGDAVRQRQKELYHSNGHKARRSAYRQSARGRAVMMVATARWNARRRELPFNITWQDIFPALEAGVCQVTGLPLDLVSPNGPWSPSIDRIVPAAGYVRDNVRIVTWIYNAAKQEYADADVLRMAEALVAKARGGLS